MNSLVTLGSLVQDLSTEIAKGAMQQALDRVVTRRWTEARDILVEKVRVGDITLTDAAAQDEAVAMLQRYARAAQEGAARHALRLLATVMRGEFAQPKPAADAFHRWADILAGLSYAEIRLLADLHKHCVKLGIHSSSDGPTASQALNAVREELLGQGNVFENEDRLQLTLSALMRTGLLMTADTWDGLIYRTSPLMHDLVKQISLEEFADAVVNESRGS